MSLKIEIWNDRFGEHWPRQTFGDIATAEKRLLGVFLAGSHYALQCENITVTGDDRNGTWASRGDIVLCHTLACKYLPGWDGPA